MTLSPDVTNPTAQCIPTWNGGTARVHMIQYEPSQFKPTVYASDHIACPPLIASSDMKRQADYFFGRLAARRALAALGLEHHDVGTGALREPVWPAGIIGSISHNDKYAVAVALDQASNGGIGVGIDIESVLDPAMLELIAQSVLSSGELAYLRKLNTDMAFDTLVSLAFSAKESFFKASFNTVGRYFDFDAVELKHVDMDRRAMIFEVRVGLAPPLPAGLCQTVHFVLLDDATVFTSCNLPPRLPVVAAI